MNLHSRDSLRRGMFVSPYTSEGPFCADRRGRPPILQVTDRGLPGYIVTVSFLPISGGRSKEAARFLNENRQPNGVLFKCPREDLSE